MLLWRILTVLSVALLIGLIVLLILKKYQKITYLHEFSLDDLMNENYVSAHLSGQNKVYFTPKNVRQYIKKYVLSKSSNAIFMIANYANPHKYIAYYVLEYNSKEMIVEALYIRESSTKTTSKVIALHRDCEYVNIVMQSIDDLQINSQIVRPIENRVIRLSAFLFSLVVFLFLFSARNIILEIHASAYAKDFLLNSFYNYLSILFFLLISLLNYYLTCRALKRRNSKNRDGGFLEYEFF